MFDLLPVGVRALEEAIQVDVVHEYDSECCCEAGETPGPPYSAFEHHQQQVGDERDPYLYLDGIGIRDSTAARRLGKADMQ